MAYLIVLIAVLARFLPHTANFSPVYGALLWGGARLKSRDFLLFPVALLALSDVALDVTVYHTRVDWMMEPVLCVAYAAMAIIGRGMAKRITLLRLISSSLAGAIVFFLISNFAVWLGWRMYTGRPR